MPKKEKKIRVRIRARQIVRYDSVVEMTQEEWGRFKSLSPKQHTECGGDIIGTWIESADCDADDIDQDDFEAEVVGTDNKPIKPADDYRWPPKKMTRR